MCSNFWENMHRVLVFTRADIYKDKNPEIIKDLISQIQEEVTNDELHKEAKDFSIRTLQVVYEELVAKNYDVAYDIVDMLHAFPHVVLRNDIKELKRYRKVYVKPLIKKRMNLRRKIWM